MIGFIRERRLVVGVALAALLSAIVLIWIGSQSGNDDDAGSNTNTTTSTSAQDPDNTDQDNTDQDNTDESEPGGDDATDNTGSEEASENNSGWPVNASQSESDTTRDQVNPVIGQMAFADRVDAQATVNAGGQQWVLSELPTETRNQLVDDGLAGRDLDPFGGEVLIVEDDVIVRAFPMNEFPPTFLETDGTMVYAGRTGDGGYPDSALVAINALTLKADRIVMRSSGPDAPSFYPEVWEEGLASQRVAFGEGNYLQALLAVSGTLATDDSWVVRANPERGLCAAVADIDYGCDDTSQFVTDSDPVHIPRIIALPVPPEGIDTDQIGVLVYGFLPPGAAEVELRDNNGAVLEFDSVLDEDLGIWVVPAAVSNDPFSVVFSSDDGSELLEWPDG